MNTLDQTFKWVYSSAQSREYCYLAAANFSSKDGQSIATWLQLWILLTVDYRELHVYLESTAKSINNVVGKNMKALQLWIPLTVDYCKLPREHY